MKKTASLVSIIVLALVCFDPSSAFADAPPIAPSGTHRKV